MKYSLVLMSLLMSFFWMGCATQSKPIEASVYLLSTNKGSQTFLNEIADDLKANRYKVESLNLNVGLLVMEPRRFVILRDGERTYGEQRFQIRQEGGSVKVRITYLCEYEGGPAYCSTDDDYAREKIRKIERIIMTMINRKLFKKRGEERSKTKDI